MYQAGDKIRIVNEWNGERGQNLAGDMDYMLGKTYIIREYGGESLVFGRYYRVEGEYWAIYEGMIDKKVTPPSKKEVNKDKLYFTSIVRDRLIDLVGGFERTMERGGVYSIKSTKTFGSSIDKPIVLGKEGNFFLRGKDSNKIKLGKILGAIYTNLTSTEIESYVSKWKKLYDVDLSSVEVSSDISAIYNLSHAHSGDLGGSCMRYKGRLMAPYEELGCKVAYIKDDDDGELLARAILWEELETTDGVKLKAIDRIFASNENSRLCLAKWAHENGYYNIKDNKDDLEVHTVKTLEGVYFDDGVPYVDTMYQLNREYRLTNYDDSYGRLQSTDGTYDYYRGAELCETHRCECDVCGHLDTEDNMYYSEYHSEYLCSDCCVWSEVMDSYIREAYAVDYDNGSDYVHEDEASFCEVHKCYATGDYYSRDNLVYCEDIGDYVHTEEEYAWVEDVDEYYHKTDDLIICEYDGTYWLDKDNYIEHMEKLLKDR